MGQYDLMKLDIQKFAASGSISCTTLSQSIPNNSSVVRITFTVKRTSGTTHFDDYRNATINCDGQTQYVPINLPSNKTSNSCYADFTVYHASDGTKSVSYSASVPTGTSAGTITASGSQQLNTIPRYATITRYEVYPVDETTIAVDWNADVLCDSVAYSLDGANWVYTLGTTIPITGLSPNSYHTVSIAVRRADSQLWTYSWDTYPVKYATTYSYPYVEYVTDFVIGSGNCNANLINPLGRQVTLDLISNNDGSIIGTYSGTYNGLVGAEFNTAEAIDKQYRSIPNNPNGTYYARVTCGSSVINSSSKTYYVNTTACTPEFNLFTWQDINPTTLTLTGSNSTVIKDNSNIEVTIPVANKATAKNYATISKYEFRCGNKTSTDPMTYSSSEDVSGTIVGVPTNTFEVRAIDSRGIPSAYVSLVAQNYIAYNSLVKGSASVHRVGEVSEQTTLEFDAEMDLSNFGDVTNSIKSVVYQYKTGDNQYTTGTTTITPTVDQDGNVTFTGLIKGDTNDGFDATNVYTIQVTLSDELSSVTWTLTLQSGSPHLAWHKNGLSVMNKYDENLGGAFQVNGVRMDNVYSTTEQKIGYWINNKPIYRKVYNLPSLANGTQVAHGLTNFNLIDYNVMTYDGTTYRKLNYTSVSYFVIDVDNTVITLYTSGSLSGTGHIILEYTKSTD